MAQLPQELIDAIVQEVKNKDDLQACSLTARNLVAASQSGLFRQMSLRWDSSSRIAPAFARARSFLYECPHLSSYIRELTLDLPSFHQGQVILETILQMLLHGGHLERLAINGHAQHWDELLSQLTLTIPSIIELPSMQCLHLLRISSLPASVVFQAASSVRVLSLNRVIPQRVRDITANIPPNTHLETLILPWCLTTETLLRACDFLLAVQNLRRLSVDMHSSGYHHSLIASSSAHLQYLEIECGAFSTPLNLPPLPALRSLAVLLAKSVDVDRLWTLPENLTSTIAALPAVCPHLETLKLTIHIRTLEMEPKWHDHSPFPVFDSLFYREQLPLLRGIHCCLGYSDPFVACAGPYFELALERFVALMENKLPAAFREGILTVGRGQLRSRFNYFEHLP
ncbi:hypothetical protein MSAN_00130500 [Mycena sanguinolenta]|uniref:F-box domain-containing protein n=1 Tax=Mycena sanguinolenta TaxID=230812 RepID=A0A8H6ZDN2_9AGAR|nr:hypothetical protein MSAN_00130500 [Mycena sanguinolenta]